MRVKKGVAISDPQVGRKGTAGDDGAVTARALDRGQRCDPRHSNRHGTRSRAAARFMPITLFLAGQAFELEVIEIMSAAFVAACDALHLKIGDPAAKLVAEKVIAYAQRGIRDPDVLCTTTLKELGLSGERPSVGNAAPSE